MATTPLQTFSIRTLMERIKYDLNNAMPDTDFTISDNEIVFHIDQARAASLIGNIFNLAKVEGVMTTPEAYITTYLIENLVKDEGTGEWYADLPQPPVSLPLGYSITDVYMASNAEGNRQTVLPIENKAVSYREMLPLPSGSRYWVVGQTLRMKAWNGASLLGKKVYVNMIKSRTISMDENINVPDDQIEVIYNMVMDKLKKRIMNPQDIIQDQLPAGNKTS